MKMLIMLGAGLVATAATELVTDYRTGRVLDVEVTTTIETETTAMRFERDGVEEEPRFGGGGGSLTERTLTYTDEVLVAEEGRPKKVQRAFGTVVRDSSFGSGEESQGSETESPLAGVVLELSIEDGELDVAVVEGDEPDAEQLEGHFIDFSLDALLPLDEVEEGDAWELDDFTIRHALAFELDRALFPREERGERGGGGRGGGRRGGGRRGGGSEQRIFRDGEWEGEATLVTLAEEFEGRTVARIDIEMQTSGELEDEERGRRRDFLAGAPSAPPVRVGTEFEVELEGRLLFDVESGLPVDFSIEGTLVIDSLREMDRGGSSIVIESTREGTFEHHVRIMATESEDE